MLKKAWHYLVCALPGYVLAWLIVGGGLRKLGWVSEEHTTRVVWMLLPFTAYLVFCLLYKFDPRSQEEIAATEKAQRLEQRRERSRYREDL